MNGGGHTHKHTLDDVSPRDWWKSRAEGIPRITTDVPGPSSRRVHRRTVRYYRGLNSQAVLFPVAFDEGFGVVLKDVDGNEFLDFSSGIYVTSLGHSHPKVSETVARWAAQLDLSPGRFLSQASSLP